MAEIRPLLGCVAFFVTFFIWFYGYTNVNYIQISSAPPRSRRFLVRPSVPFETSPGQKHLLKQCNLHKNGSQTKVNPAHFMVDTIHKVAYCRYVSSERKKSFYYKG